MAAYDLEEQEQLASLRAWWKQHGGMIAVAIIIASLVFTAWNGWNWYRHSQSANAGVLYEQLQKAVHANDAKAVKDAVGTILEQYPRTSYAPLAALLSAKVNFENGDLKTARIQLQWASDHARSSEIKAVARLRLAKLMIDDNSATEAATLLEKAPERGFQGLYAATRGDALLTQNKLEEARAAYKSALDAGGGLDQTMRELVQVKLSSLGGS